MKEKKYETIEDWECEIYMERISSLISDGYRFREIKNLLKDP